MTRSELYQAVWTKPVMHVAKRIGISDRGLIEVCRRVNIPTPPRGYWRRVQTGQTPDRAPLPNPGDDSVVPLTVEGALFMGIKAGKANAKEATKPAAANTAPAEEALAVNRIQPSAPQRTDWAAEASPITRVANPFVEVEYQKLMRSAEMFERHQTTSRLLAELSLCLPTESVRAAAVLQHWIAMMRRQHTLNNPVEKLLVELRRTALDQSVPSWWDIA